MEKRTYALHIFHMHPDVVISSISKCKRGNAIKRYTLYASFIHCTHEKFHCDEKHMQEASIRGIKK